MEKEIVEEKQQQEDENTEHLIKLNNGISMIMLGYGTLSITDDGLCEKCIYKAIKSGYRMFYTAAYQNEEAIGKSTDLLI